MEACINKKHKVGATIGRYCGHCYPLDAMYELEPHSAMRAIKSIAGYPYLGTNNKV